MKSIITIILLSFLLIGASGCDITKLPNLNNESGEGIMGEKNEDKDKSQSQSEDSLSHEALSRTGIMDLVKINPDIKYNIVNNEGYYSIGPVSGHIVNIEWKSPNSLEFRTDYGEKTIISSCVIEKEGLKTDALIEMPSNGMYINNSLRDGKGLVFISLINGGNFYWFKEKELKEYKNAQYYYISPLQKYVILFPGDLKTKPLLINLESGAESSLPAGVDHGWPEYTAGLSFSADETRLLYEDWSNGELCIYDIKGQKEYTRIGEKEYKFLEGALSPNGKMTAYLKCALNQEYTRTTEGRNPVGEKLVIYDIEKKKVLKEISGQPLIYARPVWSPDSKSLAFNMLQIPDEKDLDKKITANPHVINISTGKTTKLSDNEEGLKFAAAWDEESRKVMADYRSRDGLHGPSVIELKLGDELDIDISKYYLSRIKKSGTDVYEIIDINNSKLKQFTKRNNLVLSLDEKYIAFSTVVEGSEYLIIAPK